MLALTALAQRTIQALADLFCLLTVASVFWIAYTIDDPDPMKLTKLGMYASFVLIVNWIVRRK